MPDQESSTIAVTDLKLLSADLKQLASKPKQVSLPEAITHLRPDIEAALANGYSLEDIAQVLGQRGIKVAIAQLEQLLSPGTETTTNGATPPQEQAEAIAPTTPEPTTVAQPEATASAAATEKAPTSKTGETAGSDPKTAVANADELIEVLPLPDEEPAETKGDTATSATETAGESIAAGSVSAEDNGDKAGHSAALALIEDIQPGATTQKQPPKSATKKPPAKKPPAKKPTGKKTPTGKKPSAGE